LFDLERDAGFPRRQRVSRQRIQDNKVLESLVRFTMGVTSSIGVNLGMTVISKHETLANRSLPLGKGVAL
jgi:hypothetical protein